MAFDGEAGRGRRCLTGSSTPGQVVLDREQQAVPSGASDAALPPALEEMWSRRGVEL
jgi:hypothetical protein